jgi:hypothetical protein
LDVGRVSGNLNGILKHFRGIGFCKKLFILMNIEWQVYFSLFHGKTASARNF